MRGTFGLSQGSDPKGEHAQEQPSRKMGGSNPAQVVSPLEVKLIPLRENQRVNLAAVERPRIPKRLMLPQLALRRCGNI